MKKRASTSLLLLLSVVGCLPAIAETAEPVVMTAQDLTDNGTARLIVKFRSVRGQGSGSSSDSADIASLAGRTGIPLRQSRRIDFGLRVLELGSLASPGSVDSALARLRADPNVEYAELDRRRHANSLPNDTLFPGQWYLQDAIDTPSAVNAIGAWDNTTGATGVVIAVLDTGVRYEHPDLAPAGSGGRLLPGFDFVTDGSVSNDGDGWDLDASDPGDWVSSSDVGSLPFSGCDTGSSSWHGTRVSGIIGSRSDNALGVSGLTWNGWILPVRVLGKCGGFDSDIVAAMLWAGGLQVDGAPANPYPARVVNLSLGGGDTCPQNYQDAVNRLRARGVLVVASVGNDGSVVEAPANCAGVAGIGAIRHIGTKVGFSNLGPGVALSAPGGNCVNVGAGDPCLYSIDTTTNLGTTTPTTDTYTDQFHFNVGTSFSAPIVSGIAGLMLAANGRLSTTQLIARLQEGATTPFPASSDPSVPVCHVPSGASDVQVSECSCTTSTCGAGMANAQGAVQAALRPVAAVAVPGSVSPGQNVVLRGSGSGAACGSAVVEYSWSVVSYSGTSPPGIVGDNTDTATVVAPASGSFAVRLTVTDETGREDTADVVVSATAAVTTAPAAAGPVACLAQVVPVSLTPVAASVQAGGGTLMFSASVANAGSTNVSWYVDDVPGGNAVVGTVSPSGLYAAPASRPSPATVTVKAVPAADTTRYASASVTITAAPASGGGGGGGSGGGGGGGGSGGPFLVLLVTLAALRRKATTG